MKNAFLVASCAFCTVLAGCAMFQTWRAIPPPGGCDQCHVAPISKNWVAAYKAPILNDEKNRPYFQTEGYSMPNTAKPPSSIEVRKVEEERCFDCHTAPDKLHRERTGRFHH